MKRKKREKARLEIQKANDKTRVLETFDEFIIVEQKIE